MIQDLVLVMRDEGFEIEAIEETERAKEFTSGGEPAFYICHKRLSVKTGEPYFVIAFGKKFKDEMFFASDYKGEIKDDQEMIKKLEKNSSRTARRYKHITKYVDKSKMVALGHKDDIYFFTSTENTQICKITASGFSKNNLLNIMQADYWETNYPSGKGINWEAATNDLMRQCRQKGFFDDKRIRGVGVWKEKEGYVINVGNQLYLNGSYINYGDLQSNSIYDIGPRLELDLSKIGTVADCVPLIEACDNITWKDKSSSKYLAGWLAIAPFGGVLPWRPHLWLTGSQGTGKSWILEFLVNKLLHQWRHYFRGQTTEAGVRQTIKSDGRPIIADEMETEDEKSAKRIQMLIELCRQASSESDGQVVKGSVSGNAISYRPRFCALFSSIRVPLNHEADRNRFAVLEIEKEGKTFDAFKRAIKQIDDEFANRIFARVFTKIDILLASYERLWEAIRNKHNPRIGQQYGALLAGWHILHSDEVVTEAEAVAYAEDLQVDEVKENKEEEGCLNHLLEQIVTVSGERGTTRHSIGSMVKKTLDYAENIGDGQDFNTQLQEYGLKIVKGDLFISKSHAELSKLYQGSPWNKSWSKSIGRMESAIVDKVQRIGNKNVRTVGVSGGYIFYDEKDTPF